MLRWVFALMMAAALGGCNVDSYMDPSRTGRFELEPTTVPVIDRIDVIEKKEDYWLKATPVLPEDLIPGDLSYRLAPGDQVTVGVYELLRAGEWATVSRRIDASGKLRSLMLGDIAASGLTPQQLEDRIVQLLAEKVAPNMQVDVMVEQASGLRYTIYGFIATPGVFTLNQADLRLIDALSLTGGAPTTVERIYVIREVALSEEVKSLQDRPPGESSESLPQTQPSGPPVDIEDLIKQLDPAHPQPSPGMLKQETTPPIDIDTLDPATAPAEPPPTEPPAPAPAEPSTVEPPPAVSEHAPQSQPVVDVDQLEPVRAPSQPPIAVDELKKGQTPMPEGGDGDSFIYVEERGEWVRVRRDGESPKPQGESDSATEGQVSLIVERIIAVDFQRLQRGDSSQNLVVPPGDRIYVDGPPQGYIYVDGEIMRAGVYQLPTSGTLTLSRMVAAAGGLGPFAIPNRIDLTRKVGYLKEATIRLDLAAIRQRTQPDVTLKPDDHIIIGTNFWAVPLAVIRNGFRATYGFGFLLDRNFGNDVFGAPPENFNF